MSKQSKISKLSNNFQICYNSKSLSQSFVPNSAQKGKSFYQSQESNNNKKSKSKRKNKDQFYLSYRNTRNQNQIKTVYNMKNIISHIRRQDIKDFKILGIMDTKVVITFNNKLKIFAFFDQHAMHQRIRYQYYLGLLNSYDQNINQYPQWNQKIIQKDQRSLNIISNISHSYITSKVTQKLDDKIQNDLIVRRFGFQIQYSKNSMTFKVLKVPKILQRTLDHKFILAVASEILLQKPTIPKCLESIIAQISCKSAYKFNDVIHNDIMSQLVQNLSLCQYPFFCVHGRPTLFIKN